MKKWYALVGILATLMVISLATCSIQMDEANRQKELLAAKSEALREVVATAEAELAATETELAAAEAELATVKSKMSSAEDELAQANTELETLRYELAQVKATEEIKFGRGLRVFDVSLPEPGWFGSASGKVQNTSDEPMEKVMILVAGYDEDGSLEDVSLATVRNLYPQEIGEWTAYPGPAATYSVYAFGNR